MTQFCLARKDGARSCQLRPVAKTLEFQPHCPHHELTCSRTAGRLAPDEVEDLVAAKRKELQQAMEAAASQPAGKSDG